MNLLVVDFDYFFTKIERAQDSRFEREYQLYDWGHIEEHSIFYETIWQIRAGAFLRAGQTLPGVDRVALDSFWSRFHFSPRAQLFFADSNMYAAHERIGRYIHGVWLFDAHADAGYHPDAIDRLQATGEVNCENWMLLYAAQDAELHMRYPTWRHYALEGEPAPLIPLDRQVDDGSSPMRLAPGPVVDVRRSADPIGDIALTGDTMAEVVREQRAEPVIFDRIFVCKSPAWVPSWCDADWKRFIESAPVRRRVNLDGSKMLRTFDLAAAQEEADMIRDGFARLAVEKEVHA